MRNFWQKTWHTFWKTNESNKTEGQLSSSDKRWLLHWNFMTCMGVILLFILIIKVNNVRMNRQNDKYLKETMNMLTAYMASATKNEYDKIAETIRHDLVFSEFEGDMESFIQYIPNTSDVCPTCIDFHATQVFLLCSNTGELYALDLFNSDENPNAHYGGEVLTFGYDEISQSQLHISKSPGQKEGYVDLIREQGIVSVHKMKTIFCDDCIQTILNTVSGHAVGEFVIFEPSENTFYPIEEGTVIQIGDYRLEIKAKYGNYEISIYYIGKIPKYGYTFSSRQYIMMLGQKVF